MVITSPDAPIDVLISLTPMNIVQAAADLVWSPTNALAWPTRCACARAC